MGTLWRKSQTSTLLSLRSGRALYWGKSGGQALADTPRFLLVQKPDAFHEAAMDDPIIAHTATKLADAAGRVVVCGSHGGHYVGQLAVSAAVRAILLNDAGIGRDEAGVAGLATCAAAGLAAVALHHTSCRIGNGADAFARGIVSRANWPAEALGVAPGMSAAEAARRLAAAPLPTRADDHGEEHRTVTKGGSVILAVMDSAGLIRAGDDDGAIVVTGSHGGLVGDDPATSSKANALLAAFNDAGIGCDGAGTTRLPALQTRGIGGVCVDCFSARIGEGRSTIEDGIISTLNARAAELGARKGQPLAELVEHIVRSAR